MPANQVDAPRSRQQPMLQGEKYSQQHHMIEACAMYAKSAPRRRTHRAVSMHVPAAMIHACHAHRYRRYLGLYLRNRTH